MTLITTIEIDEVETEVEVEFYPGFGEMEIASVTDDSGNEAAINKYQMDVLLNLCHEEAANYA